jgi:hypothetical protein
MWSETYETLSNYERGEFRRICNYLLSHTYIVRDVYKPDKQWTEPNNDYRMVNRLFECMSEYFSVSGWKLEKDDNYGVVSLINEFDSNRFRMDRFTTWSPDGNGILVFPSILSIISNQGINDMMSELEELRTEDVDTAILSDLTEQECEE